MDNAEYPYPMQLIDGVPVEFRPDTAYDLRTGEQWVAYRFKKPPRDIEFVIIEA